MPDTVHSADSAPQRRVRVSSPASLLAVVPPLLGFEPSEPSLVVIGVGPERGEIVITLRFDIPDPRQAGAVAGTAMAHLAAHRAAAAAVVGYGPGRLVTPVAGEVLRRFPEAGIALTDVLRAEGRRYWSYVCADPGCCSPEGIAFDAKAHPAAAMFAGGPVLASREALAQTIAPAAGEQGEAMARATRSAEARARRIIREAGGAAKRRARRLAVHGPGLQAVADAIARYRDGGSLGSPGDAAWLALVLEDLPVRDDAWSRMLPEHNQAHRRLWSDVTRLARPGYVAPPASLLAFVAWQAGDGALANVALDRALADQPGYSMARLLRRALDCGAPPSMARLPMSPEDVAACYAAQQATGEPAS